MTPFNHERDSFKLPARSSRQGLVYVFMGLLVQKNRHLAINTYGSLDFDGRMGRKGKFRVIRS